MAPGANRERLNTGGSYASTGLRERTNTVESVRSMGSGGSTDFSPLLMGNASPQPTKTTKRLSAAAPSVVLFPASPARHRSSSWTSASTTGSSSTTFFSATTAKQLVDWLQRQPVPRRFLKSKASSQQQQTIYWIAGLDRVVFGTVAAADAVWIAGLQPPRYLWYMVSGACCDVIQLLIDLILYMLFKIQDASVCWAAGFFCSILFRHSFHRYLVFGDYVGGYYNSLGRMYAGYSVILVLSTIFNVLMTKVAATSHYVAWILTLLWTGIANYFILKRMWSFGGTATTSTPTTSATTATSTSGAALPGAAGNSNHKSSSSPPPPPYVLGHQ